VFNLPIDVVHAVSHRAIFAGCERIRDANIPAENVLITLADFVGLCMQAGRLRRDLVMISPGSDDPNAPTRSPGARSAGGCSPSRGRTR
jgi:hypothetical protein